MAIHKEGYTNIAICILLIFLINAIIQFYEPQAHTFKWVVYILSFVFFAATIWFFRSPSVTIAVNNNAVLSPADGTITAISEVDESEFLKGRYIKLSIAISPTDVRVSHSPISGTVRYAQSTNHATIAIESNTGGTTVLYRQLPGYLKHIAVYPKLGDTLKQGSELGFSMAGANVEVFLPAGTPIDVQVNHAVKGGQTILAQLKS